jgi:hypothetical protein
MTSTVGIVVVVAGAGDLRVGPHEEMRVVSRKAPTAMKAIAILTRGRRSQGV